MQTLKTCNCPRNNKHSTSLVSPHYSGAAQRSCPTKDPCLKHLEPGKVNGGNTKIRRCFSFGYRRLWEGGTWNLIIGRNLELGQLHHAVFHDTLCRLSCHTCGTNSVFLPMRAPDRRRALEARNIRSKCDAWPTRHQLGVHQSEDQKAPGPSAGCDAWR